MSHFAELDENNIVIQVLVGDNDLPDEGLSWFLENLGGRWVQTSFNGNIRKNFAGVGFTYDEELDAFIPPKQFESWVLDEDAANWKAPVDYPSDGKKYYWNEDLVKWSEIIQTEESDTPSEIAE
jgi:hypothetical protein